LHYVYLSEMFNYYLPTFLTSTVNQLTNQNLGSMVVPITFDQGEQNRIVSFLDKQCSVIDSILEKKAKELQQAKNYKSSLIYEYVTGKKRVKEVV
jgi:type I restriction enzyme S subunit